MEDKKERWVKIVLTDQEEGTPKISIRAKEVNGVEILGMLSVATNYYDNKVSRKIKEHKIKELEEKLEEYKNQ